MQWVKAVLVLYAVGVGPCLQQLMHQCWHLADAGEKGAFGLPPKALVRPMAHGFRRSKNCHGRLHLAEVASQIKDPLGISVSAAHGLLHAIFEGRPVARFSLRWPCMIRVIDRAIGRVIDN